MEQIESFFAMGGYGAYVWPAYGLTATVMIAFLVTTLRALRSRRKSLDTLQAKSSPRRRRSEGATDKESSS
jgi:heme exporter protein D